MDKPITTRLPKEFIESIKKIAAQENLDVSSVIRRLLAKALEEQKIKSTLEKLSLHQISIGKAARELNISLWDMIVLVKTNDINWTGYKESDLEKDLKILK